VSDQHDRDRSALVRERDTLRARVAELERERDEALAIVAAAAEQLVGYGITAQPESLAHAAGIAVSSHNYMTADRDSWKTKAEAATEAALLPIHLVLFARGHCGEGGLEPMVERALDEARQRGRDESRELHDALLEASDAFPPDMEGTVAARVKVLIAQHDQAIAARKFAEGQRDDLSAVLRDLNDAGVAHEKELASAPCIHGRDGGHMCPHCLGVNDLRSHGGDE